MQGGIKMKRFRIAQAGSLQLGDVLAHPRLPDHLVVKRTATWNTANGRKELVVAGNARPGEFAFLVEDGRAFHLTNKNLPLGERAIRVVSRTEVSSEAIDQ